MLPPIRNFGIFQLVLTEKKTQPARAVGSTRPPKRTGREFRPLVVVLPLEISVQPSLLYKNHYDCYTPCGKGQNRANFARLSWDENDGSQESYDYRKADRWHGPFTH
jgi:hypothetical protein